MKTQLTLLSLCLSAAAWAEVKLPAIFSDHMVIQRGMNAPVWGWADPGEEITVSIAGQTKTARAGADGKFLVRLSPLDSKQTLQLTVKGKNTIKVEDVLVGEVWLCSGQSNMGLRVAQTLNYEKEQAAADLPRMRMFIAGASYAKEPQAECKGKWFVTSPETVGTFSATAYFFGRELNKALNVPVGLINSSVGGTAIQLWISAEAQRKTPELQESLALFDKATAMLDPVDAAAKYQKALERWTKQAAEAKAKGEEAPRRPQDPVALQERKGGIGTLFNGMIAPLIPYALRGAIWYQGEANSMPDRAAFYQNQLTALIRDWRERWGQESFPFAWVQLPNFTGTGRNWPVVREGMLKSLQMPDTGMAVAIDIGEPDNIHPKNKQEVGRRLGMWALGSLYGKKLATSGPLPAGHQVKGSQIVLPFTHTDAGLVAKDGEIKGFQIAGADKKWVPAVAKIAGNNVVVSSPEVTNPVAVRYAWANNPECNLYNGAGLPATPFRTDDWPETQ